MGSLPLFSGCGGGSRRTRLSRRGAARERLDVLDEAQEIVFVDEPLKGRHQRLEARDELHLRRENRLAQIALVSHDGLAVGQLDLRSKDALQRRSAARAVVQVTRRTRELLKELGAACLQRTAG